MKDGVVDIEGKEDLMHVASMYFKSLDQMLEAIGMDQSTYYSHLNERADRMSFDHAKRLANVVHFSEPRYRFNNSEDYIEVPESDGWGTGRIKLDSDFRKFLFGRRLFDPLNEELIESISGFSRANISNYRNEDRWIPEEGYKELFNYFRREFQNEPTVSIDIYSRHEEDPYFEDLKLKEFAEYFAKMDEIPKARSKYQIKMEKVRETREKFDQQLGSYLEEWEKYPQSPELRSEIIDHKMHGNRRIHLNSHYNLEQIADLAESDILEPLEPEKYWIKI